MATSRKLKLDKAWYSWVGGLADVRRVADLLETARSTHPNGGSRRLYAELEEGDEVVNGDAADVINTIDPRKLERLTIFIKEPSGFPGTEEHYSAECKVQFGYTYNRGVTITVESEHLPWTRSTAAALKQELRLGVKRWGAIRSGLGYIGTLVLTFLASFVTAILVFRRVPEDLLLPDAVWATAAGSIVAIIAVNRLRWLCPPFELTENGSSGTRRTIATLLFLVQIPVGVLVNSISP